MPPRPTATEPPAGHLYRRNGRWWWRVRLPGEPKARNRPLRPRGAKYATKNRRRAVAVAQVAWREAEKLFDEPPRALAELLDDFEQDNLDIAKPSSAARNRRCIRRFLQATGITDPEQITPGLIKRHLRSLRTDHGLAPKTVVNHRGAISSFCRFLMQLDDPLLDENPVRRLPNRKEFKPSPVRVPDESIEALIDRAAAKPTDWYLAVLIARHCGLRISEIQALRGRQFERGVHNWVLIVGADAPEDEIPKGRATRNVPVPGRVWKLIEPHLPADRDALLLSPRIRQTWIERLKSLTAGLPGFGTRTGVGSYWHALRAYCAMEKARAGYTLYELMSEMGWRSPEMAQRYIDIAQAGSLAAARHLDPAARLRLLA